VPFQLRRMVLVNAGTNKHVASGRITMVDPRGGALVVGENAVGKTFTLRLIPLFFGHSTRDLVALEKGQEGSSFIFPSPLSAVCFEYQRGSDAPENLRLVVMRPRLDGSDAPEYRIFPCGYRKELFVQESRFMGDEGTVEAARKLGIVPTKKLTTSEYRSVILRHGFSGQDSKKLHAYSLANSFSNKPLPNLDKLVATMVKKSLRFEDLVSVAVGLIQDDIGLETHRGTLKMRQQKGDIARWMSNLHAARRAVALQPRIEALRSIRLDVITRESEWRKRHHDVKELVRLRTEEKEQVEADLKSQEALRAQAVELEQSDIRAREQAAHAAGNLSSEAAAKYETARGQMEFFKREDAERWVRDLSRELPLSNERAGLVERQRVLQAAATDAALAHSEAVGGIERASSATTAALEAQKSPLRDQFDNDITTIGSSERQAVQALDEELEGKKRELEERRAELEKPAAEARACIANPAAPAGLQEAVRSTSSKLISLGDQEARAGREAAEADRARSLAMQAFSAAEQRIASLKKRERDAQEQLSVLRERMTPEAGTLLSALRSHDDDSWKRNLARVLNPELLGRSDLKPSSLPEGGESLYGWMVDVAAIDLPAWADDECIRKEVAAAEASLADLRQALEDAQKGLPKLSADHQAAQKRHLEAEAEALVLVERRRELASALTEAEAALARGLKEEKEKAEGSLRRVEAELGELRQQLERLRSERAHRLKQLRDTHEDQRNAARKRRDDGIDALNTSIREVDVKKHAQLQVLNEQFQAQLREKGIDPKLVEAIASRVREIDIELVTLAEKKPLVESYTAWLRECGPDVVRSLGLVAADAARRAAAAAADVDAAKVAARKAHVAYEERTNAQRERRAVLESEVLKLTPLLAHFDGYISTPHDRVDTTMSADEMRRVVGEQHLALKQVMSTLGAELHHCISELTISESTVKQLVNSIVPGQDESAYSRSTSLLEAYRRLPEQVIGELNNSLGTILNQISQFLRRIAAFETEVSKFNSKLQEALVEIKRFERLSELKLNIVADFKKLEFYDKLKGMDEVIRRHLSVHESYGSTQLPSKETVHALNDFMGVLKEDGLLEVDLSKHIALHGSVVENGRPRSFKSAGELSNISSTGLTSLILITLLVGLVYVVRRGEPVCVPWVADEVGTFDQRNFKALLELLKSNQIDVITATPHVDPTLLMLFSHRYMLLDRGEIALYEPGGTYA
jgi:hypothetical protein